MPINVGKFLMSCPSCKVKVINKSWPLESNICKDKWHDLKPNTHEYYDEEAAQFFINSMRGYHFTQEQTTRIIAMLLMVTLANKTKGKIK